MIYTKEEIYRIVDNATEPNDLIELMEYLRENNDAYSGMDLILFKIVIGIQMHLINQTPL